MSSLTDDAETRVANWLAGKPDVDSAPVLPYQVALLTALGSDAEAGTEVSGGSYARQEVDFGQTTGSMITNTALIRFENLPAGTVVGVDIYDSAATPVRWFHGGLAQSREIQAGDPLEFGAGAIRLTVA